MSASVTGLWSNVFLVLLFCVLRLKSLFKMFLNLKLSREAESDFNKSLNTQIKCPRFLHCALCCFMIPLTWHENHMYALSSTCFVLVTSDLLIIFLNHFSGHLTGITSCVKCCSFDVHQLLCTNTQMFVCSRDGSCFEEVVRLSVETLLTVVLRWAASVQDQWTLQTNRRKWNKWAEEWSQIITEASGMFLQLWTVTCSRSKRSSAVIGQFVIKPHKLWQQMIPDVFRNTREAYQSIERHEPCF